MFTRPDTKNVNKISMVICGLTLGFIRFYLWVLFSIIHGWMLTILFVCSDINKPLSSCKKRLADFIDWFFASLYLGIFGYYCNKYIKVKI